MSNYLPGLDSDPANVTQVNDPATLARIRQVAQSDPVPNLSHRWGEVVARARQRTEELTLTLRNLDAIQAELKERGLEVATDLGPIGNAAAAARRDLERTSTATFELPR